MAGSAVCPVCRARVFRHRQLGAVQLRGRCRLPQLQHRPAVDGRFPNRLYRRRRARRHPLDCHRIVFHRAADGCRLCAGRTGGAGLQRRTLHSRRQNHPERRL